MADFSHFNDSGRAWMVDVSAKEAGDNITAADFNLPKDIVIIDSEDEIYAGIKTVREEIVEEPEEVKPAK